MHPEGTSEAFGAWKKAAGLRQPHIQIQPHNRSRCHLMQVHLEQMKDVHHHGVQGHPKAGGEQVTEDNHFVGAGMSNSFTRGAWTSSAEMKPRRAKSSRRDGVIFDKLSTVVVGPPD